MEAIWVFLKGRALYVSVAHDAFNFDISWLGLSATGGGGGRGGRGGAPAAQNQGIYVFVLP